MDHIKSFQPLQPGPDRRSFPRWIIDLGPYLKSLTVLALAQVLIDRSTVQGDIKGEPWLLVLGGRPVPVPSLGPWSPKQTRRALDYLKSLNLAASVGIPSKGSRIWIRGPKWRASSKRVLDRLPYEPLWSSTTTIRDIYDHVLGSQKTITISRPSLHKETSKTPAHHVGSVVKMSFAWDPSLTPEYQVQRARRLLDSSPLCSGWREWIDTLPTSSDPEAVRRSSYQVLRQLATGRILSHGAQIRYCDYIYRQTSGQPLLRLIGRTGTGDDD